jgi:hypothetical protein
MPTIGQPIFAEGHVHDLDDLLAVDLAERAAEDGRVLGEHGDRAAVDRAGAGDDAVAVGPRPIHAERGGAVADVLVELDERSRCRPAARSVRGR